MAHGCGQGRRHLCAALLLGASLALLCLSAGLLATGDSAQAQAVGAFAPLPYENAEVAEVIATPVKLVQSEGEPLSR